MRVVLERLTTEGGACVALKRSVWKYDADQLVCHRVFDFVNSQNLGQLTLRRQTIPRLLECLRFSKRAREYKSVALTISSDSAMNERSRLLVLPDDVTLTVKDRHQQRGRDGQDFD
jgi:hypothetical protein